MDLCVEASRVEYGELHKTGKEETSAEIRNRVCTARKIQEQRYEGTDIRTNSGIGVRQMEEFCQIGEKEEKLMRCAFSTMNLTARTYHKVLKVARTIADLDGEEQIGMRRGEIPEQQGKMGSPGRIAQRASIRDIYWFAG